MPSISSRPSDVPALGETIVLSDERAASEVTLIPARGALITSFSVANRALLYLDPATLADPTKSVRGGIPILFPSPGKLVGDAFSHQGTTHALKQHGFARDLPWAVSARKDDPPGVTLTLEASPETLARYPFPFRFVLDVTLRRRCLALDMRIDNPGSAPLPFALGLHPYFQVEDKAQVRIETDARHVFDNVTKTVRPLAGFDLTAEELDYHLLDHGRAASALLLEDGRRLEARGSADFTRWVVWTVAGKPYVCLEPWTAPANALNTGERLTWLPAGATYRGMVELELVG